MGYGLGRLGWGGCVLAAMCLVSAAQAAPTPTVTLSPAGNVDVLLGESFSVTATFDNTAASGSGEVGYNPQVEIILPPEVTFGSASSAIFGPLAAAATVTVPAGGQVTNPLTGETLSGLPPGATYLLFELPVGSFTPDQTPADIAISATLANTVTPGVVLPTSIAAIGLFALGADPLGNPGTDPVIRGDATMIWADNSNPQTGVSVSPMPATAGSATDTTVTPVLYIPDKQVVTRFGESETATGPNFPLTYTLGANVANTATINNFRFTETLPGNLHFTGITAASVNAGSGNPTVTIVFTPFGGSPQTLFSGLLSTLSLPLDGPTTTPPGGTPGGTLAVTFSAVTGDAAAGDAMIAFQAYVPKLDTAGSDVVGPASGADATVSNTLTTSATGATGAFGSVSLVGQDQTTAPPVQVAARNLATQKSVALLTDNNVAGLSPGDVVRFTIQGQISDYFAHDQLALQDVLGDGYDFDILTPGNARLTVARENGVAVGGLPLAFTTASVDPAPDISVGGQEYPFPAAGTLLVTQNARPGEMAGTSPGFTTLVFDLSALLGELDGGAIDGMSAADGYTTGIADDTVFTLTFDATIQRDYENPASYTNDPSIDSFDSLANDEVLSGHITSTAGGAFDSDGSGSTQVMPSPSLAKQIVAVNGGPLPVPLQVRPGDTITFALQIDIPIGSLEAASIDDFLPLPVLAAADPDADGMAEAWVFDNMVLGAGVFPAAGHAAFGPSTTTMGYTPTANPPMLSISAAENRLSFAFPPDVTFEPMVPQVITVQLLFSVTVNTEPFADNLFLTNYATADFNNSGGAPEAQTAPVRFTLREPALTMTKGVSATGGGGTITPAPGSPVDSDLTGADAADTVTYVLTVENRGGAPAYDVTVTDPAVSGLTGCTIVSVRDGTGTVLATTAADLTTGIVLTNPLVANDGTLGPPYGADTALITVTCTLAATVAPRQVIDNLATVTRFAGIAGGPNFVDAGDPSPYQDGAAVTIASPQLAKAIQSIAPNGTGASSVTAGDTVTYAITVTLPEGTTPGLVVTDTLPSGFQYVAASVQVVPGTFNGTVSGSPGVVVGGSVATNQTVQLSFGAVTVTGDNDATTNAFVVTLQALVLDNAVNDGLPSAQTKTNRVSLDFTGNPAGAITAQNSTTFREPNLTLSKSMSPPTPDAGDTVTVTLTVNNTGTAPAYDVQVSDALPSALFDLTALTSVNEGTTPAGFTYGYASPTVTYTAGAGVSIAAGGSRTFTFTAKVRADVTTGSTYQNSASVSGDSQDGTVTQERGTTNGGNASVMVPAVAAAKALTASSESWTVDPTVAVGEVLTFQLTFTIPEGTTTADGTTPTALIVDTLPAGYQFESGTATIRAVADTSLQAANYPTGGANGALPGMATAITPAVVGQDLRFDLGTLTNNDSDAGAEQVIVTYQALVLNTSSTNRTDTKTNTTRFTYLNAAGTPQSATASYSARIGEPKLVVGKTAAPSSAAGGDTITFTVTLTNQSDTFVVRAWEPVIRDPLPARYVAPYGVVSATLSRGAQDVSACAGFSSGTLTLDLTAGAGCLAASERYLGAGESIVVVYTATLDPAVAFEEQVTNTATGSASSLPGDTGTGAATPGSPGSSTGERTGSNLTNELGQAVNDLTGMHSATVTAERPSLGKSGTVTLPIGGTTTHTVSIDVPVGTTTSFVLSDDLPSGLRYTGAPIVITLPGTVSATNAPSTTPGAGTDPLVFDFGDVTNNGSAAATITVAYQVEVQNVLATQRNTALTDTATLTYDGVSLPAPSASATVTVSEPNLNLAKMVTAGATGSQAGSTVSYQVTLGNSDTTATAYRVDLRDVLPAGLLGAPDGSGSGPAYFLNVALTNPGGQVVRNSDNMPLAAADHTSATTNAANDTLTWPLFDVPPGASLTITYDAIVANGANAGDMLANPVSAAYDSLAGGGGRDGSDGSDDDVNPPTGGAVLNNYNEADNASITVAATLALQKTLTTGQPDDLFTIGEPVLYDVRVDLIQGTTGSVVVTDVLPPHLRFDSLVAIVAGTNISYGGPGTAVEAPAGTVTIDLGDVTNAADADATNDFLVLRLQATVLDDGANVDGQTRTNSVSATSDAGSAGPVTRDITLVEPDLEILKVPGDGMPSLGDEVTFTVTVRHTPASTADAFDVVLTDVIPSGLAYVPGSTMGQAMVDETAPGAPVFDLGAITLADGEKIFSFRVHVALDAAVGTPIVNTIDAAYASLPGAPGDQRDYTGSGSGGVTPDAAAPLDATKTVVDLDGGSVLPGDVLEYTVVIHNTDGPVTGAVFTDPVPAGTSYVAASLSSDVGTTDDSGAPLLRVDLGDLAALQTATIRFRVRVGATVGAGTIISNQGSVDSDQTVPEPTDVDGDDGNGDQPTDVVVGATPAPALRCEKRVGLSNDTVPPTGTINTGDEVTYLVTLRNTGGAGLSGVTFADTVPVGPPGVTVTAIGTTQGTAPAPANTFSIPDIGAIPAGGSVTISIVGTVTGTGMIVNQGTCGSTETGPVPTDGNPDPGDGPQPTVFSVAPPSAAGAPDLSVSKSATQIVDANGDGVLNPGERIRYTIAVVNAGAADATDVQLTDTFPAGLTVVPASAVSSQGVVLTESPLAVNLGTLAPGAGATVTVALDVGAGVPSGVPIANQASAGGVPSTIATVTPYRPITLAGFVYRDLNNDGSKGAGEAGIGGVTVTLSGTDVNGNPVLRVASTMADGSYRFSDLPPGTYMVVETQPGGFLDGKDTIGTPGGSTGADQFTMVMLTPGTQGTDNNFGELPPSSLSGFVYLDAGNDGIKGASESGIPGATLTLTGTDDLGNPVNRTTTTAADGAYTFANLRPGTYSISETQPAPYSDGKDTIGTPGGTAGNDVFSAIVLVPGVDGMNNNFGELGNDLTISKTHIGTFVLSSNADYTITVRNIGTVATTDPITVTDLLPAGLKFVSGSGAGWSCSAAAQLVTCTNPGPLAVGASSAFTLTVRVVPPLGTKINTASVSTPGDSNPNNNSAADPTDVRVNVPAPALSPAGLAAGLLMLLGIAGLALRRARRAVRARAGGERRRR